MEPRKKTEKSPLITEEPGPDIVGEYGTELLEGHDGTVDLETSQDVSVFFEGSIPDIHKFLESAYRYYYNKGFWVCVSRKVLNLGGMFFIMALFLFLVGWMDYDTLLQPRTTPVPLHRFIVKPKSPATYVFIILFSIVFIIYWLLEFVKLPFYVYNKWQMKRFYNDDLHITEDELHSMFFQDVLKKMLQCSKIYNSIEKEPLTELDLIQIIMRKDNYMIALFNKDVINLKVPCTEIRFFTQTLAWALDYTLFAHLFAGKRWIKDDFARTDFKARLASSLKKRFYVFAIAWFLLLPFLLTYLVIYAFFRYAEDIRHRPSTFSLRDWSVTARWKFRDWNELAHHFDARLNRSYEHAQKYSQQFHNTLGATFANFASLVLGSLVAVVILLSVIGGQQVLIGTEIAGKTLLWWTGIISTALVVVKGALPRTHPINEPNKVMQDIQAIIHYFPATWVEKAHTPVVRNQFFALFQHKLLTLLLEFATWLLIPLLFFYSLPSCAEKVVDFVAKFTDWDNPLGPGCSFSGFSDKTVQEHGNKKMGLMEGTDLAIKQSNNGKLEASILNFRALYPTCPMSKTSEGFYTMMGSSLFKPVGKAEESDEAHHIAPPPNTLPLRVSSEDLDSLGHTILGKQTESSADGRKKLRHS